MSINGRHEAIAVEIDVQELIFDNIRPEGISRLDWIDNLYCPAQDLACWQIL
nr:papain fold toxin domain-containing protein [Nostoc flagelliforme]